MRYNDECNELSFREHMGESSICSQINGSYPTGFDSIVLIDINGSLVHQHNSTTYSVDGHAFTIVGNLFTCKDISILLPPKRKSCSTIERLYLGLGYSFEVESAEYDIDITDTDIVSIFQVLTMMALKDTKLISSHFTQHKQLKYGEHVFNVYMKSVTGSGSIKAKNQSIRWLNEQDTLQLKSKLFTTSNYQAGVNSMKYTATDIMNHIIEQVHRFFSVIKFKRNDLMLESLDFIASTEILKAIPLRDTMLLLSNCRGFMDGFVVRPIIMDRHYSRIYSIFTSISSDTRKQLGYKNYDIGSAMQTISLQLVKNPQEYPLHKELVDDKTAFRTKVMLEMGKSMSETKQELSKADNLDNVPKRYAKYPILQRYCQEAQKLRKEVIEAVDKICYTRAYELAKPSYIKKWNKRKKEYEYIADTKKESSLFFFIWTQYEREIRHAMMSCFNIQEACHEVHDAIYSKEDISIGLLEKRVLELTGFEVRISND